MRTAFPCLLSKAEQGGNRSKKSALAIKGTAKPAEYVTRSSAAAPTFAFLAAISRIEAKIGPMHETSPRRRPSPSGMR
jgi:hypothetical protein